jgi:ABC-type glycerol-3-phosphate transport system substrate-binding protein
MGSLLQKSKKQIFGSILLATFLAASVFAVGATTAAAEETVTHWNWRSVEMPKVMGEIFDRFRKDNPDIDLQVEDINFIELIQKMELSGRAGAMPDTFELWVPTQLARFAEEGWILSLDEFIERDKANGEDVIAPFYDWADTTYKGHVYILPSMGLTNVMAWNKTAFEAAGLPPRAPETCDELVEFARKLNNPPEMYGLGLNGNGPELWLSLGWIFYANGARIGRVDRKFHINSPEAVEALQFIVDLNNEGLLPSFTSTDMQKLRTEFSTGKVAMIPDWNGVPSVIEGYNPDFEWGVAKMPVCKTTGAMLMGGDSTYAISATSKNPEAAWKLIKHLTSFESQKYIVENWPFFITRMDVWEDVIKAGKIENSQRLVVAIEQAGLPNAYSPYREMPPQLFEAVDAFRTQLHLVVFGEKSAQEGMDAVAEAWEILFEEWEDRYGELGERYY